MKRTNAEEELKLMKEELLELKLKMSRNLISI